VSTAYRRLKYYKKNGEQGLIRKKCSRKIGTGRMLTLQQEEYIQYMIKNSISVDFDHNYSIWSRRAISELTENKFGIHIAIRIIGDYLMSWNFSPLKTN
jgi:transposase